MPLINTIDELCQYVELSSQTDIKNIRPSILAAERAEVAPLLGAGYMELFTAYTDQTLSAKQTALLALAQEAIANIAMSMAVSRLSVQISDAGVRRAESDSQKTAYQYQETNAKQAYLNAGYDVLDNMLAYLDANKADFATWAADPAYTAYKNYLIPSGIDFNRYYAIKRSRLTYISLAYIMNRVENIDLVDIIGKELYMSIKAQYQAGELTNTYAGLLENYIRPGIALLTVAKGLLQRAVDITENGVTVSLLGPYRNSQERKAATPETVNDMIVALNFDGNEYFKRLGEELEANSANYPDYVQPAQRMALINFKNNIGNGIYTS
jgi:hypothetical protein